ncbi:Flavin-containing monooxygenase FMO GS-OX-like 9 [Exaiptasia diaphana]|nr:Flavin-containing monooxygenase FMO GS-OX-like 9 [Exaiptasia diaphana]
MSKQKRICVIGAGPSGMAVLHQYNKLKQQGKDVPQIVCYDKQSDWGGLWVYNWETGRWSQNNLRQWIKFNHVVRQVTYNDDTDDFSVVVKNLPEDKDLPAQIFDYVIVSSGHYSVPYIPYFEGIDQFPGRIIHSHDLRNASQFKDQTVLIAGSSFSAEDIAIQALKYGAKKVIISHRTRPLGYKWPPQIEERPLLTKIDGNTVHFKDGYSAEVIVITFHSWRSAYDSKALLWMNQFYTFTMFDMQAKWALEYIVGDREVPDKKTMEADVDKWTLRLNKIDDMNGIIDFQTDYVKSLAEEVNYGYDVDCADMIKYRLGYTVDHPLTYRDTCYVSKYSGVESIKHHTSFMEAFDDSMETFLDTK